MRRFSKLNGCHCNALDEGKALLMLLLAEREKVCVWEPARSVLLFFPCAVEQCMACLSSFSRTSAAPVEAVGAATAVAADA